MGTKGGDILGRPHEYVTADCQELCGGDVGTGPVRLERIPAALLLLEELKVDDER